MVIKTNYANKIYIKHQKQKIKVKQYSLQNKCVSKTY